MTANVNNKTIKVKAAPNVKVPIEGSPRKYITDAKAVEITVTPFYQRRIDAGELILQSKAK